MAPLRTWKNEFKNKLENKKRASAGKGGILGKIKRVIFKCRTRIIEQSTYDSKN